MQISGWGWTVLWIVLWVFIWPLFLLLMRKMRGKNGKCGGNDRYALDILKERYAKGEIDKEKFDEMKRDL
jgi:putative membrane protein